MSKTHLLISELIDKNTEQQPPEEIVLEYAKSYFQSCRLDSREDFGRYFSVRFQTKNKSRTKKLNNYFYVTAKAEVAQFDELQKVQLQVEAAEREAQNQMERESAPWMLSHGFYESQQSPHSIVGGVLIFRGEQFTESDPLSKNKTRVSSATSDPEIVSLLSDASPSPRENVRHRAVKHASRVQNSRSRRIDPKLTRQQEFAGFNRRLTNLTSNIVKLMEEVTELQLAIVRFQAGDFDQNV
ncbi:hypothetical protein DFH27DRAFT_606482 [Peziza echinospora]|nr:hypothetical protein DFH27DRAFT_606482 [Peziza echinospora]